LGGPSGQRDLATVLRCVPPVRHRVHHEPVHRPSCVPGLARAPGRREDRSACRIYIVGCRWRLSASPRATCADGEGIQGSGVSMNVVSERRRTDNRSAGHALRRHVDPARSVSAKSFGSDHARGTRSDGRAHDCDPGPRPPPARDACRTGRRWRAREGRRVAALAQRVRTSWVGLCISLTAPEIGIGMERAVTRLLRLRHQPAVVASGMSALIVLSAVLLR
jgi:hypothetical protein